MSVYQRIFWKVVAIGAGCFAGWMWDDGEHKIAAGLFLCAIGLVVELRHPPLVEKSPAEQAGIQSEAKQ